MNGSNLAPTEFLESNALLATQEKMENEARDILHKMTISELKKLGSAADRLSVLCAHVILEKCGAA